MLMDVLSTSFFFFVPLCIDVVGCIASIYYFLLLLKLKQFFFFEAGSLQVIPNTGLAGMSHTLTLCTILNHIIRMPYPLKKTNVSSFRIGVYAKNWLK